MMTMMMMVMMMMMMVLVMMLMMLMMKIIFMKPSVSRRGELPVLINTEPTPSAESMFTGSVRNL
eukprot:274659-Karenia_brevis.AAC.1